MRREGLDAAFAGHEDILKWMLASAALYSGADLDVLSIRFFEDAEEYDQPAFLVPEGLDALLEALQESIEPNWIFTGHPVRRIEWEGHGDVLRVWGGGRVFEADRVLVTLPLGVLKSGRVEFEPSLPPWKRRAIDSLGFGTLDPVYLEFPHRFWPEEKDFFGTVDSTTFPRFFNRCKIWRTPALTASMGAGAAKRMEKAGDEEVIKEAMAALRAIFGPEIPEPVRWRVMRWSSDPYALGSYSNLGLDASPRDRASLAEPLEERLFFAGEATDAESPGTLQGAYLSGLREADRIADLVLNTGGKRVFPLDSAP
jgi:monoamine oxidase